MNKNKRLSKSLFAFCAFATFAQLNYADTQPSEYKTNIGGDWFTSSTWNMLNPATSYPNDNTTAFCVEGSNKTLTLNENVTVGRMIGGGGNFDNTQLVGTGAITFDVLYDSTNSYAYAASALWGHGSLTYSNKGGVVYTSSDKTEGWDDNVGIKIFNTKAGAANSQTLTFDTSLVATDVTSMYGKSADLSTVNFNGQTRLTTYHINAGTTNFNGTVLFDKINVKSASVANFSGNITSGVISSASGTVNFTGDYTLENASANISSIGTTGNGIVNFNHRGVITTGAHYYENSSKTFIADGATVAIDSSAEAANSWGVLYLIQTGGSSVFTVSGKIDASDYAGSSTDVQLIRNWGNIVLNSTAEIIGTGKISNIMYMGRSSKLTINGNATISGKLNQLDMNQQKTTGSSLILNNSKTLANFKLIAKKDTAGGDGTTSDTLTNSLITVSGDSAFGTLGFAQANDQFTIDLADCTLLTLNTLYSDSNANGNKGKIVFTNFKSGVVYVKDVSNINLDTFSDYVMTDIEGVILTIKDNYIVDSAIPEPSAMVVILGTFVLGLVYVRRQKK